jgi:hypothetical protein
MPSEPGTPSPPPDPHRNLFWMFVSFMGISIPKQGQERRAMRILIVAAILFLIFVAVALFTLFRVW